jgi:hypothetical protein
MCGFVLVAGGMPREEFGDTTLPVSALLQQQAKTLKFALA